MKYIVRTKHGVIHEGDTLTWADNSKADGTPDARVLEINGVRKTMILRGISGRIDGLPPDGTTTIAVNMFGNDAEVVEYLGTDNNPNTMFKTFKSKSEE